MSKQFLASSFRHKHHVILAIPPRVGQALIILVHRVLLWFRLIKPPEENLLPERSKLFKSHWSNQWLTLWDLQLIPSLHAPRGYAPGPSETEQSGVRSVAIHSETLSPMRSVSSM